MTGHDTTESLRPRRFLNPGLIALVLAGGTVGTAVRAWCEEAFGTAPGSWPWSTFAINLLGSFLLGWLVATLAARGGDHGGRRIVRLAVGTGVLGGFTTYSTFILEVDELVRDGQLGLGAAYALGSVVLGVLLAAVGMLVGGSAKPAQTDPDGPGR